MRSAIRALTTAAVIGAAALLWNQLPTSADVYRPFTVAGAMGGPVSGRGITATVEGVRTAPQLSVPGRPPFAAVGRWLVVQAVVQSGDRPEFAYADLKVGSRTYTPTDRLPPGSVLGGTIQPGFLTRGAWVFDVAEAALDDEPMTLRTWVGNSLLDSRLDIGIDRGRVERSEVVSLARPRVEVA